MTSIYFFQNKKQSAEFAKSVQKEQKLIFLKFIVIHNIFYIF